MPDKIGIKDDDLFIDPWGSGKIMFDTEGKEFGNVTIKSYDQREPKHCTCSFCNGAMTFSEATREPGSDDWACRDCRAQFDAEDAASARVKEIDTADRWANRGLIFFGTVLVLLVIWMLS
jgi:hypothetical protein